MPHRARQEPSRSESPILLGREEWLSLPALGLPAVLAKVDTGAATSALHAFAIEPFEHDGRAMLRFGVHPVPGRDDVTVRCEAPAAGRRWVTSSSGERELRHVIETEIEVAGRRWPIEITLANRIGMRFRMLLGRQAISDGMVVAPRESYRQPILSHDVYRPGATMLAGAGGLRIGLLVARDAAGSLLGAIESVARGKGHDSARIEAGACRLVLRRGRAIVLAGGEPVGPLDAVLAPLSGEPDPHALAILRQLELAGSFAPNRADAIAASLDPWRVHQLLSAERVATAVARFEPGGPVLKAGTRAGRRSACLVVGEAAIALPPSGSSAAAAGEAAALTRDERRAALGAARALGLGFAIVELVQGRGGPGVLSLDAVAPSELVVPESIAARAAEGLVDLIERHSRAVLRAP
jgi:ribosomal protein S6--L-glutamate ligase